MLGAALATPVMAPPTSTFHILGAGAIGQLFTHHLLRAGFPVTLLLHSQQRMDQFTEQMSLSSPTQRSPTHGTATGWMALELLAHGRDAVHGSNAQAEPSVSYSTAAAELLPHARPAHEERTGGGTPHSAESAPQHIQTLLVTTKASQALQSVAVLAPRLAASSVVVLLQNGVLAVREQLVSELFPDAATRPALVLGSTTHGAYRRSPFHVVHAGKGACVFGQLPDDADEGHPHGGAAAPPAHSGACSPKQQRAAAVAHVLSMLVQLRELAPCVTAPHELHRQLLLKLVVNCAANPLSALLHCKNGGLLASPAARQIMGAIVGECRDVLGGPLLDVSAAELLGHVEGVVRANAANYNSMLQDIVRGTATEVDYLNGYVVRHARQLQQDVPWNQAAVALVHAREQCPRELLTSEHL